VEYVESFFSDLETFGVKLGLERVRRLFDAFGRPDEGLRFLHVAGTNGKGSVCALAASALSAAGFKTGLYTSPHLLSVRERFRIDGKAISESALSALVEEAEPILADARKKGDSPTYFEMTTAMAARWFRENGAEFAVWETGMGGRFDATNAVAPAITAITPIALDHAAHLGGGVAEIAFEKAGIIKPGVPVVLDSTLSREARGVVERRAAELDASLSQAPTPDRFEETFGIPLPSLSAPFLELAAPLAAAMVERLSRRFEFDVEGAVSEGFPRVRWPGRFHRLSDGSIIDGAHNPSAAEALAAALRSKCPGERFPVVFASSVDKDAAAALEILAPFATEFIFPERIESGRSFAPAVELLAVARRLGVRARLADDLVEATRIPRGIPALYAGSLYLAGDVLRLFEPRDGILNVY
jgi:dihydrofolate synthase/folylpolyglutamate synthase